MISSLDAAELTDVSLEDYTSREASLLKNEPNRDKISGKAWGRVKNIFTRHSNYPKTVFLILGTEFCERFNYYGMRTILVIYLTEWQGLQYHTAVACFHLFSMIAYFSPLLGAVIADGYLGRFKTIFYISIVYAIGTLVLALTAFPPPEIYGPVVGLILIGLGTGGIKPCVTAFGGDQFSSHQEKERMTFFSAFYFMINLGSMISTFLTPILRADVHCIENSCYPLAFGVPTILMFLSVVIFVSGKNYYKHVPPTGNLFGRVICCIGRAAKLRIKNGKHKHKEGHWLDYATDKYEESFVEDIKALLKVLWLFLPLPVFWALYDQQGSRWTLQAVDMNGDVGSLGRVKPDQMQTLNPLLILLLIPFFEKVVYPCLNKLRIPNRPLQRMCAGMALCSLAFVIAGFVQVKIESGKESPLDGESGVTFLNTANCSVSVNSSFYDVSLPAFTASPFIRTTEKDSTITFQCSGQENAPSVFSLHMETNKAYRIAIHQGDAFDQSKKLSVFMYPDRRKKDGDGLATISIINYLTYTQNLTVVLKPVRHHIAQNHGSFNISVEEGGASEFITVEPDQYQLFVPSLSSTSNQTTYEVVGPVLTFGSGSVQSIVLQQLKPKESQSLQISVLHFISLEENEVSMAWLIPQYFVITTGEILFSITGLLFAYTQAPQTMRSVLQAAWQFCVAVGDLIVVIVAQTQLLPTQSAEFFMFAALMGVDTIVFMLMAYVYKSRPVTPDSSTDVVDTTTLVSNGDGRDIQLQDLASGKLD